VNKEIAKSFVLMLVLAISISYAASKFTVLPFDQKSYHELQEKASPAFSISMQMISYLGEAKIAATLTIIAMAVFALRRQWIEAIFILATTSSVLIAFALKDIIQRTRPFPVTEDETGLVQSINQYSYPSGHVLFFVVFFGFLAYLAFIHFTGRLRTGIIIICAIPIVLIGPSRIFLGVHWASDVVGSYIIGTLWLFVLIFAYQWAVKRKHQES
jgi:undecaprenyl-diphosphatase